jgi:sec-independent protein translocase protein TatB
MGFGGLTFDKIFIILLIALFVIGPEKLPGYAKRLGELVRSVKRMADGAKDRMRDEMGPEFDDVDWKQLDPRQYDPRRIIRDALLEDEKEAQAEARKARALDAAQARRDRVQAKADSILAELNAAGGAAVVAAGIQPDSTPQDSTQPENSETLNFDDEAT